MRAKFANTILFRFALLSLASLLQIIKSNNADRLETNPTWLVINPVITQTGELVPSGNLSVFEALIPVKTPATKNAGHAVKCRVT